MTLANSPNPYLPYEAEIVERIQETPDVFTWRLRLTDETLHKNYLFFHGQFNMLYHFGVGEIPISIKNREHDLLTHTIRVVGRVTRAMAELQPGHKIGIRGPFGRGWPIHDCSGKDVVFITAGLGCAPVISAIQHVAECRRCFGRLVIMQSVKHRSDLLWQKQYDEWRRLPNTQVLLAASREKTNWPNWELGRVSILFEDAIYDKQNCVVMMCGPDGMMSGSARMLSELGIPEEHIYMSIERNMQCGIGHCGHCQVGSAFSCKDGPVFSYPEVKEILGHRGF